MMITTRKKYAKIVLSGEDCKKFHRIEINSDEFKLDSHSEFFDNNYRLIIKIFGNFYQDSLGNITLHTKQFRNNFKVICQIVDSCESFNVNFNFVYKNIGVKNRILDINDLIYQLTCHSYNSYIQLKTYNKSIYEYSDFELMQIIKKRSFDRLNGFKSKTFKKKKEIDISNIIDFPDNRIKSKRVVNYNELVA